MGIAVNSLRIGHEGWPHKISKCTCTLTHTTHWWNKEVKNELWPKSLLFKGAHSLSFLFLFLLLVAIRLSL